MYHPLYLPTDWSNSSARRFPIIVEYMGNGPFNSGYGDISTGRPEDSNLGWGMADPPGSQYIWISMPFVTADLGPRTEVSTYWWGCPSSDASHPCRNAFNITPTIRYLHSAVQQAVSVYNGDPDNVVITGERGVRLAHPWTHTPTRPHAHTPMHPYTIHTPTRPYTYTPFTHANSHTPIHAYTHTPIQGGVAVPSLLAR